MQGNPPTLARVFVVRNAAIAVSREETVFNWRQAFGNDSFAFLVKELKHQLMRDDNRVTLYFTEIRKFLTTTEAGLSMEESHRRKIYGIVLRDACLKWFGLNPQGDDQSESPYAQAAMSLAKDILQGTKTNVTSQRSDLMLLLPHVCLHLLLAHPLHETRVSRYIKNNYTTRSLPTGQISSPSMLSQNTWDPFLDYYLKSEYQMTQTQIQAHRNCVKRCLKATSHRNVLPKDRQLCTANKWKMVYACDLWYGKHYRAIEHPLVYMFQEETSILRRDGSSAFTAEDRSLMVASFVMHKFSDEESP